ncbi:MAG TPA: PaaI family thioesterase [Bacteroidales bacterium]|nr:PaaI family thioesterase [Bacteroidales bacterium]
MKKIINPYTDYPGYNCFGCAPCNTTGLKMEFFEEGDYICSNWMPGESFQGHRGVLHGGIQQVMMDEIGSWVVHLKLHTSGVTARMQTRFLKPVYIMAGQIHLKASLVSMKKNFAEIDVALYDGNGSLCAKSTVVYYTFDEKEAREKYHYPGIEAFYDTHEV